MDKQQSSPKIRVVVGAQWGDEGKGKLVDILSEGALCCARYNGGANAGHTIIANGSKIVAHQIPCGAIHGKTINLIGNGVVLHIQTLDKEIQALEDIKINAIERLYISNRCHITLDLHRHVDSLNEASRTQNNKIGTTGRGIGPSYSSKSARLGLRMGDFNEDGFWQSKYMTLYAFYLKQYQELKDFDPQAEIKTLESLLPKYRPRCVDSTELICETLKMPLSPSDPNACHFIVEGANATMLDIDFGTYPFVTSSNTVVGGVGTGLGIPPQMISEVIGVVKAYTTRVGEGPFPTEQMDSVGEFLQVNGGEFGATTGRKRRCGWLDIPMLRYSYCLNGFHKFMLTKLDVLTGLDELKICVDYKLSSGKLLYRGSYPASISELSAAVPVYESLPGWKEKLNEIKSVDEFPANAKKYIKRVQELTGVKIQWIGTGPEREDILSCEL